jgi:GNAT superfamily N-acetyltransferase
MEIRRPVPADAADVAEAWEDARDLYFGLDARVFLPPNPKDDGLGRALVRHLIAEAERPNRWIRIAEVDNETAGFITATLFEPDEDASRDIIRDTTRRHIKIDTLVVKRSHGRKGVGRALISSVEEWADRVEASLVKVGTFAQGPAVAFYEDLGYTQRSIIFEKYLD